MAWERMLYLHSSNRLENLVDALAGVVREGPADAFTPETIIVQSRGMQRWIALRLAERLGIWANAEYPFPAKFLWEVFQNSLGEDPSEASPFDWERLEWAIYQRLPEFLKLPEFDPISLYLADPDDLLKRYQLANRIARTFDHYVVYRPAFLRKWEDHREGLQPFDLDLRIPRKEQAAWQEILWRCLVEEFGHSHRAATIDRFASLPVEKIVAPKRVSIFGLSTLAPSQLEVFGHIAKKVDIHLFQLTPCRGYYADLVDRRFLRRVRRAGEDPASQGFEEGNQLLASMGRLGGDFSYGLLGLDTVAEIEHDTPPSEDTALHCLQADLYHLHPCRATYPEDDSIQFHACFGTMREVEVLKNRLLDLLERDPTLRPRDILVMAPDIETYAQAIEAVFPEPPEHPDDPPSSLHIPYSLADRRTRRANPAGEALLQLVDLLGSRFETTRMLAFLDLPLVRERFAFTEDDLSLIRHWAEQLNVKWGRDPDHREQQHVPGFREGTWQHLLDRLFLGYAMGGEAMNIFAGTYTYPDVEGSSAETLGRLSACLRQLFTAASRAKYRLPLPEWERLLLDLLRHPEQEPNERDDAHDITLLANFFERLRSNHATVGFEEAFPLDVLRSWLVRNMDEYRSVAPFLGGGVTCCNLVPMRSIPFRVVCLLGMNDGDYPRIERRPGFDLTARDRQRGDRSRRENDRYLFLEAILSARDVLYISYVGMGIRDGQERPPSVLVAELLDALHDPAPKRKRVVKHPLQAYSVRNFDPDVPALHSYQQNDLDAAEALRKEPEPPLERFATHWAHEPPTEVHWQDLATFFESPCTWFLKRALGLRFEEADETPDDRLTSTPNELEKYLLRHAFLEHGPAAETREKAIGRLPPGRVGHVHGLQMLRDAEQFKQRLARFQPEGIAPETWDIDIQAEGLRIVGEIPGIYPGKHALVWRFGTWRATDEFTAHLRHLLVNLRAGKPVYSVGFGRNTKSKGWGLRGDDPSEAMRQLVTRLKVFKEGQRRPLPFFPETSKAYAKKRRFKDEGDTIPAARLAGADKWYGSFWSVSERDKYAAHRFLFQDSEPFDHPSFDKLAEHLALWAWMSR